MTARQFLEQYGEAQRQIDRLEEELETETVLIDAVRSVSDNDGMPHGNNISKPTEEKAVRLAEARMRLISARMDAIRIRQEVFDTINMIGGLEADVLTQRYVYLKSWADVCDAVYYSWPSVRNAWHRGEERIQRILDNTYKNLH